MKRIKKPPFIILFAVVMIALLVVPFSVAIYSSKRFTAAFDRCYSVIDSITMQITEAGNNSRITGKQIHPSSATAIRNQAMKIYDAMPAKEHIDGRISAARVDKQICYAAFVLISVVVFFSIYKLYESL